MMTTTTTRWGHGDNGSPPSDAPHISKGGNDDACSISYLVPPMTFLLPYSHSLGTDLSPGHRLAVKHGNEPVTLQHFGLRFT